MPAPPGRARSASVDEATLRESFELNFWAHQSVAQNAVRVMRAQGLGGCLLFNTSKQAVNPGPDFGPYGLPKAATLFLMRQYTLDHGADGIRANAVNADRIRSGLLTDEMIAQRSTARGLSEADYMGGNLLGLEVTADDVAQAFVSLAKAPQDDRRGGHRRRRQHRGGAALSLFTPSSCGEVARRAGGGKPEPRSLLMSDLKISEICCAALPLRPLRRHLPNVDGEDYDWPCQSKSIRSRPISAAA